MNAIKTSKYQWILVLLFLFISIAITSWWLLFDGFAALQSVLLDFNEQVKSSQNKTLWLSIYALICVLSQLLIVPSGSLILIAAGFIFSPVLAAAIFSVAQVLCSWPIYKLGNIVSHRYPDRFNQLTRKFKLPENLNEVVRDEGFYATILLRLTPVIPSAVACLLASGLDINLRKFIPATIVVCWIRPLFFASLGGSLQSLANLSGAIDRSVLQPLLLIFFAAMALLLVKILLRYKSRRT